MTKTLSMWAKAHKVDPNQLKLWQRESQNAPNLLAWCLLHRKIDVDEYLKWASETFAIPILNPQFFELEPETDLYARLEKMAPWSESLYPVGQWEGTVFVGCVEPLGAALPFAAQLVLVDPARLLHHRERVEARIFTSIDSASAVHELPEAHEVSEALPEAHDLSERPSEVLELSETPSEVLEISETPQEVHEPLHEVHETLHEVHETLQDVHETNETEEAPEASSAADAPEGLSLSFVTMKTDSSNDLLPEAQLSEPAEGPDGLSSTFTSLSVQDITRTQVETTRIEDKPTMTEIESPPALPTPPHEEQMHESTFVQRPPEMIDEDSRLPRNLELAKDDDEMAAVLFERLSHLFKMSMILRTRANEARVWKYDRHWAAPKSNEPVFLDTPSAFRVVVRSKAPFHGPVFPSPVNDKFFAQWGVPLPDHLSIVPILNGEMIVALILCVGSKEANTLEHLDRLERYRNDFQNILIERNIFKLNAA